MCDCNLVRSQIPIRTRSWESQTTLSTLKAARQIKCRADSRLRVVQEIIGLPRADMGQRIAAMELEQQRLLQSLQGTYLNLKTFLPLAVKYNLSSEFPSYFAHRYLHEDAGDCP